MGMMYESSYAYYSCKCGGEILEQWDAYGGDIDCDSCDNPIPIDYEEEDMIDYSAITFDHPDNDFIPF